MVRKDANERKDMICGGESNSVKLDKGCQRRAEKLEIGTKLGWIGKFTFL